MTPVNAMNNFYPLSWILLTKKGKSPIKMIKAVGYRRKTVEHSSENDEWLKKKLKYIKTTSSKISLQREEREEDETNILTVMLKVIALMKMNRKV